MNSIKLMLVGLVLASLSSCDLGIFDKDCSCDGKKHSDDKSCYDSDKDWDDEDWKDEDDWDDKDDDWKDDDDDDGCGGGCDEKGE